MYILRQNLQQVSKHEQAHKSKRNKMMVKMQPEVKFMYAPLNNAGTNSFASQSTKIIFTHTRIEPYECQCCHKKITSQYRRNEHEKVCNGSVKLICWQCQTTFTDRQALQRHKESQHLKKEFRCSCGKVYKYYSSLF